MPLWNIPGPFLFHGGCALAKSLVYRGQWLGDDNPAATSITDPNGAGKTTSPRPYLPENAGVVHFVNADLIASGMSPLKPEIAAIAAARMVLGELDRLVAGRAGFAFETTLSGLTYLRRLPYRHRVS